MSVSARRGPGAFWPTTRWGWWAAGFLATFLVFAVTFLLLVLFGFRGGETPLGFSWTFAGVAGAAVPLGAAATAVASLVCGLIATTLRSDRSAAASGAMVVGLVATLFMVGEVVFGA